MGNQTALFEIHKALGAKIVDFGGWDMPVQYTNIIDEHINTRNNASLFDISHMGVFDITGEDALEFVQYIITNDVSSLMENSAIYTPLCYENGTFVDDIIIYKQSITRFRLVVNASNIDKDFFWIENFSKNYNINIKNLSDKVAILALQGPKAINILQSIVETNLSKINKFSFFSGSIDNVEVMIARTGYTGEDGFELYFDMGKSEQIWNILFEKGKSEGLKPVGLGARDTLRLEAGMRLYGNDIDESSTPMEANLKWTVKFNKSDFVGKKALQEQINGVKKTLVGFEMIDKPIARHGYTIHKDGNNIGYVTSGTFSPSLKKPIGMAYISTDYYELGNEIEISIRNKQYRARVINMPFVKTN